MSWLLSVVLVLSLMPMMAFAEDDGLLLKGTCGDYVAFELTPDGVLTIKLENDSSDGKMQDEQYDSQKWAD